MATYYVATTGNDGNDGGSSSPWRTISHAMNSRLSPGDEVVVRPGTYREAVNINNGGSAAGDVTLRSEVPGQALIRPPSDSWTALNVYDDYVTIEGFDISGANGSGIGSADAHHITVRDNIIHDNAESGVQLNWGEFFTIEGNTIYGNAASGWYSGISIYQAQNITGDSSTPGYRVIIRDNISYDNVTERGLHTDGNGIILDDFQNNQNGSTAGNYKFPALVENNILHGNGGKGIAVHWSDNVTIRNNTAYHNNMDPQLDGTWQGELSNQDGNNNVWVNNIAVADPEFNNKNNTAIGFYGDNSNVTWKDNITYNGRDGDASQRLDGGNPGLRASEGNLLGVDPQFAELGNLPRYAGANTSFELSSDSPAVDAGTGAYGLPARDIDGDDRTVGPVDMGAQEYQDGSSGPAPTPEPEPTPTPEPEPTNAAPEARDDSSLETEHDTTIVISAADLLSNDSDSDGDSLSLTSVSAATGGTARVNSAGDVVFDPASNFSGTATFTYAISDGNGGSDTAKVSLTVAEADTSAPEPEPEPQPEPSTGDGTSGLWADDIAPASARTELDDWNSVELGVKFRANVDGEISAVQFYESAESEGSHPVRLWAADGTLLAQEGFSGGDGAGWREVSFDEPVEVEAGETYVASYHAPRGKYAVTEGFFNESVTSDDLTADQNAGVYSYGAAGSFPDQTFQGSNYWVDVVFHREDEGAFNETPAAPKVEADITGTSGNDKLAGNSDDNVIAGLDGNDRLYGRLGDDMLLGHDGNDELVGATGADILIGGQGDDVFQFISVSHSSGDLIDVVRAGEGVEAFEGAGVTGGDRINVSRIDAVWGSSGDQSFTFGSTEKGGLSVVDDGGDTLVRANCDNDAQYEFELRIEDGDISAATYTEMDFLL